MPAVSILSSPCPLFVSSQTWYCLLYRDKLLPELFTVYMLKKPNVLLLLILLTALLLIAAVVVVFNRMIHNIETQQPVHGK